MDLWAPQSCFRRADSAALLADELDAWWRDPAARVLVVSGGGRVAVTDAGALRWGRPVGDFEGRRHLLLGWTDAAPVFVEMDADAPGPLAQGRLAVIPLDDTDRDVVVTALALTQWHEGARRCGRCGTDTEPIQGGQARHCAACVRDEFPRTDPAVITAILDAEGRLLLAHNAAWEAARASLVAGFVAAGESLEACVRREVFEEVGVRLGAVRYVSSQPWPFPRSLMLGFVARSVDDRVEVDGVEIDRARYVSRVEFDELVRSGELLMPTSASIASTLIGMWRDGTLPDPEP